MQFASEPFHTIPDSLKNIVIRETAVRVAAVKANWSKREKRLRIELARISQQKLMNAMLKSLG